MPSYAERHHMPYSAAEMYALVADVEQYPVFLPWCDALLIRRREAAGDKEIITADMTVAFKLLRQSFTSRVTLDPGEGRIDVQYIDGPFRWLINHWRFEQTDDGGAIVDFFIDFQFKSRALDFAIGPVFTRAILKLVTAFEGRAHMLYGQPSRQRLPS